MVFGFETKGDNGGLRALNIVQEKIEFTRRTKT